MSSLAQIPRSETPTARLPLEQRRGIYGMWCVIATEFSLFVCLFASYFYLGNNKNRWAVDEPPKLHYPLIMLVVLLASSFVLEWGSKQIKRQKYSAGRLALIATILIGLCFVTLQVFEYMSHWKTLTPYSDSYGSIFYTITTFHAAHLLVGLLILAYVGFLPRYGRTLESPHRSYEVAALYWHFVDVVWILIVLILYVIPNLLVYG